MKKPGPLGEAERMTCYTREVTAGSTAESAIDDLDALSVPDSLTSLVGETQTAPRAVADVDLESACGPPMTETNGSSKCDGALGGRNVAYVNLGTVLDRWSPYL